MKLIDYDKYKSKWSLRGTIALVVVDALATGFFLGSSLIEAVRGSDFWTWIFPSLTLGFASGVGALHATLVALHNCPPSTKTQQSDTAPRNAAL